MVKVISLVFLFFFNTGDAVSLNSIRDAYKVCNQSKENAEKFYEMTKKAAENGEAIYEGYHGAALALQASFGWNPFSKMSYFNRGKKLIDKAIQKEPDNIELRMIRLSIQSNTPKILGYNKNIEEDRDFISANVDKITGKDLKEYIEGYISHSEVFTNP